MNTTEFRALLCLLLSGVLALAACQSSSNGDDAPEATGSVRARITNQVSAEAEVVAIRSGTRTLTLRRENGVMIDVQVSDAVRNFAQISVGDRVRVRFAESLEAVLLEDGASMSPPEAAAVASRAAYGEAPAASVGAVAVIRVRVESYDKESGIVVFSQSTGELVSHRIAAPQGREFAQRLKAGDVVELIYAETLALSVDSL